MWLLDYWLYSTIQNSIFIAQESFQYFGLINYMGLLKNILNNNKNQFFEHFRFLDIFTGGGSNQFLFIIHKNSHFLFVELSHLSSFITFSFSGTNLHHGQGNWSFSKISNWNYPLQYSRYLFYHLQLLIHNLQVIQHEHISRLKLIIKKLPQIKTRTTPQIQMTHTNV